MTAVKGLLEALVMIVVVALVGVIAAAVWVAVGDGGFVDRLGISLIILGALLATTGGLTVSHLSTADTFAWFGLGPERQGAGGGRVLTGTGVFLFVTVPLVVVGGVLAR